MKKSIILFLMVTVLSVSGIVYTCIFVDTEIRESKLTEETIEGDVTAAEGISAGFRADSGDDLHWINSYDYSSGKSESVFKRGEIVEAAETSIFDDIQRDKSFGKGDLTKTVKTSLYDDIRFTGWSMEPFVIELEYDRLGDLQKKDIHAFYEKIQKRVVKSGKVKSGKIRLGDYLDYYPVSFQFQLGTQRYDSGNALTGLKIYDEQGILSPKESTVYDRDVDLYTALNDMFRIPVIDNEYHLYKVSKVKGYDQENSLGYTTEIIKSNGVDEDYYEFDPVMAIQEDSNNKDRNRLLFIVNNRTAKGNHVDVSEIRGGYGIYEISIEVGTKTIEIGPRVVSVSNLIPVHDEVSMVYALDETAEYVEMTLSDDHRYLAVFSVTDGKYFVEMIDADSWESEGPVEMFPASETMTYAWGEDGSLAVTNHQGYVAVVCRTENEKQPHELLYSGKVQDDFDKTFFDTEIVSKKNSYTKYQYGVDEGLAIAAKDGKVALVQNQMVHLSDTNIRNAALECAVIDRSGVVYRGRLKSDIVDIEYSNIGEKVSKDKTSNLIIRPIRNKNWAEWEEFE